MILTLANAKDFQPLLRRFWNPAERRVQFEVMEAVQIQLSNGDWIEAPKGMVTDFRSAPNPYTVKKGWQRWKARMGRWTVDFVIRQMGLHDAAVFVHDTIYLLYRHLYSREFADQEMLRWLIALGERKIRRILTYWGVVWKGQEWWDN